MESSFSSFKAFQKLVREAGIKTEKQYNLAVKRMTSDHIAAMVKSKTGLNDILREMLKVSTKEDINYRIDRLVAGARAASTKRSVKS